MTPITINQNVVDLDNSTLTKKLNFVSFQFCVNADFTKIEAVQRLVEKTEMYVMEALLRIVEDEYNYRPYQNKIYENVEEIFVDQDAYNINRMLSSLRRAKFIPIDPENDKYIHWMKNRIKYGIAEIINFLDEIEYYDTIEDSEHNINF